jgi:hypothetical protein
MDKIELNSILWLNEFYFKKRNYQTILNIKRNTSLGVKGH